MKKMKKLFGVIGVFFVLISCIFVRPINTPTVVTACNENHISFDFNFSRTQDLNEIPNWTDDTAIEQYYENNLPDWVVEDYNTFAKAYGIKQLRYYIGNELITKFFADEINNVVFKLFKHNGNLYYANLKPNIRELEWTEFDINGKIGHGVLNIDTTGLTNFYLVGRTQDFSIIQLDGDLNKLHCVKSSSFLENLTIALPKNQKITRELLDAPYRCFGYVHNNSLIFPVIFKDKTGMRLELCTISTEAEISCSEISTMTVNSISRVFYGNTFYSIENADKYICVDIIDENGKYNTIYVAIVNDDNIKIKKTAVE